MDDKRRSESERLQAEADAEMKLVAFAERHGCPEDVAVLPWLLKRGLVREEDGRLVYVEPQPDGDGQAS